MRPHLRGLTLAAGLILASGGAVAAPVPAAGPASPAAGAAEPASPASAPLAVLVTASTDDTGARVTLTLSRRVAYRLEETRSKLRVLLPEPVAETSMVDHDLDSDVVRRIRFDATDRGTEVVFHLGRGFATFSSAEQDDPFRITFQFLREGVAVPPPAADEETRAPEPSAPQQPQPVTGRDESTPSARVVVIDPGHGGDEQGAVSRSGLKEKDLVLDIARRLRTRLAGAGFSVTLTRDEDQSLGLTDRTAIANHAGAGLFLSIHANSSMRAAARGAETYFLSSGSAGDEQAMAVARQENLASLSGPGADGDASRSEIRAVLWDMAQAEFLSASSRLATSIQSELDALDGATGDKERGVKQAPFRVLVGAAMPAVLVEVGFLTNDDEEKKLATEDYRDQIAAALASAVQRFTQARERAEAGSR